MDKKILNSDQIKKKISELKKKGKKITLCHGVFDYFHLGHINYLKEAKIKDSYLIVSITTDRYVNKGFARPIFNHNQRAQFLSELSIVDYIVLSDNQNSVKVINLIKPDFYAKGLEYKNFKKDITGNIIKETNAVKKNKGKIIFVDKPTFSSSNLINNSEILYNEVQKNFIKKLKVKYGTDQMIKFLDKFKKIKSLIIGETIIDKYSYCEALGKSGKEPYLAFNEIYEKIYLGGAASIAKQFREYTKYVKLLSMIGEKKEFLNFIKDRLPNISIKNFIYKSKSPTILKKRYIDIISKNKVFGSYSINTDEINKNQEVEFIKKIKSLSKNVNIVLISDYGHGFITKKVASNICNSRKFIALNAQVNAANIGYHSIAKYRRIDALIINETELRYEMKSRYDQTESIAKKYLSNSNINYLVVTMGSQGSFMITKNNKIFRCPAFASKIVDKVGAGDSMLSIISICLKLKIPEEVSLFLGAIIASYSLSNYSSEETVNIETLKRTIRFMLK